MRMVGFGSTSFTTGRKRKMGKKDILDHGNLHEEKLRREKC